MARNSRSSRSRPSKSRPAKMGRKWTQDDVLAYNIKVVYQDLTTFFGVTYLPSPGVGSDALAARDITDAKAVKDHWTANMLLHMFRVPEPDNIASSTLGFVRGLFDAIHYTDEKRFPLIWSKLRYVSSQGRPPQVDICIWEITNLILLVVKVHMHSRGFDPESRLISDAIAASHNNNVVRVKHLDTNPLTSQVMPGIVVDGTMPTFYKIPITSELVTAVESGKRPEQETVVHAYVPEVPRPQEGMKALENRPLIFSCFEAFKRFM